MLIHFATDHAGFPLKEEILAYVRDVLGYEVVDHGGYEYIAGDDYPDYVALASESVSLHPETTRAIIFGGSGQGEAMVANRFRHVRAVVFYGGDFKIITLSREHNDANVLSLGARFVNVEDAKEAVSLWLSTPFLGEERHVRRIAEIDKV